MGDAQALSGVGEELEESSYHVGPHEKLLSTQHATLQDFFFSKY